MIENYLAVYNILQWINYVDFLKITQFKDGYYAGNKWEIFRKNYFEALLGFDDDVRLRFDDYIKERL